MSLCKSKAFQFSLKTRELNKAFFETEMVSRLFNSALLVSVAFSAAAESHSYSLSQAAFETVGLQSFVNDPDRRFVLYRVSGLPEIGFTLHAASASALVELNFDLQHTRALPNNGGVLNRVISGDVTVRSVSCNGRNIPGNKMIVAVGLETVLPATDYRPHELDHVKAIIAQLNRSEELNALIGQHCVKASSQANIASSNYAPILRTQNTYLQVKRTVEPAEIRFTQRGVVTSAFIVSESFSGREPARFHLERFYLPLGTGITTNPHHTIIITPLTGPNREARRFIRTTLVEDDWAEEIARIIPYTLYRVYDMAERSGVSYH